MTTPRPKRTTKAPVRKPAAKAKVEKPTKLDKPVFPPILRDDKGLFTQRDAAAIFGMDPKMMQYWRTKKGCTVYQPGGHVDMPRLIQWWVDSNTAPFKEQLQDMKDDDDGDAMRKYQLRNMRSANILQDIKVQEAMEGLIPKDALIHHLSTVLSEITSRLRPVGFKLGPKVSANHDGVECTKMIDELIDSILKELTYDIVMDMGRSKIDPFEEADIVAANAEKEAMKEMERES